MSTEANTSPIISGAAIRYAEALFDLALENGALETVESDLDVLRAAAADSDDFRSFLQSPVYSAEEKARAMGEIAAKAGVSGLTRNFLGVVAANRRLFFLEQIIAAFTRRLAEHRGEVTAEAVSAAALNEDQTRRFARRNRALSARRSI
ncbi:MAG: ATP synthase F1 subunit delta [Parvularculaceae bacterium]